MQLSVILNNIYKDVCICYCVAMAYITLKEASQKYNKHPDTFRRLFRDEQGNVNEELKASHSKLINRRLAIDESWLVAQLGLSIEPLNEDTSEQASSLGEDTNLTDLIKALTDQLSIKDSQLATKDSQIAELTATIREKEQNTTKLQDQFQQLLARQLPSNVESRAAYDQPVRTEVTEPMQTYSEQDSAESETVTVRVGQSKAKRQSTAKPKSKPRAKPKAHKKATPKQVQPVNKRWWQR